MTITDIKQQLKRQDRYSIFADGKYSFSLSENELMSSGIKVGKQYSKDEFKQLLAAAVLDKAYMRVLDLLTRRARSQWEIEQYLNSKEYEVSVIDQTISRLKAKGYVDDHKFAESWVNSRRLLKSTSKRKLRLELRQKRVDDLIIDRVLDDDETDEMEVLVDLVTKKRHQSRYKDDLKLMQYLSRQGFEYDMIKEAINKSR